MRLRAFSSGTLAVAVAGGLLGTMFGLGAVGQEPETFEGSSWLWSRSVGELARVNGSSGRTDLTYEVAASTGNQVEVAQNTDFLLLHDQVTGRVSSVDLARMSLAGSRQVDPDNDVVVLLSGDDAVLVDRTRGRVRAADPETLRPRGEPVQFPPGLVGGDFDESGRLWLGVPSQGVVVQVRVVNGARVEVERTVEVADPDHELAVTVLDDGAFVADLTGDAMVAVVDGEVHRLTAPVPLAGAQVPGRTVGGLVAVTVPDQSAVVVVDELAAGGVVQQLPLPGGGQVAVPFAGRVYVPDQATGTVEVFAPDGAEREPVELPGARGPLELEVRGDLLFVNAVDAPAAAVVDAAGETTYVDKFDPDATLPEADDEDATPGLEPPGPPSPVHVHAGDGQVEVSWAEADTTGGAEVDRYVITWAGGSAEVDGDTLATVATGLENGETYRFRVVAENEFGQSPPAVSEPVTPVAAAPATPAAPTAEVRRERVTVSWEPVRGATEYVVTPRRNGDAGADPPQTVTGESVEFEGLSLGATYTFTVVARNGRGGESDPSPPSNEVVPFSVPDAPEDLSAAQVSDNDVVVDWSAPDDNGRDITHYVVRDGDGNLLGEPVGTRLTITSAGGLDSVSVRAVNRVGAGEPATADVDE